MRRSGQRDLVRDSIVSYSPAIRGEHADGLCCIDRAAAAQAHQAIVLAFHEAANPRIHHRRRRVGHGLVENLTAQPGVAYLYG